jgi:hypothetical protein
VAKVELEIDQRDVYMICYQLSDIAADHEHTANYYDKDEVISAELMRRSKVLTKLSKEIAKQCKAQEVIKPVETAGEQAIGS